MKTLGITQVVKLLIQLALSTALIIVAKLNMYMIVIITAILITHIFSSSLVRIDDGFIKIFPLNPFRKDLKVGFNEVDKITLTRGFNWGLWSNIVVTVNGRTLKYYLNYDSEMDDLYKYLSENFDNVEFS